MTDPDIARRPRPGRPDLRRTLTHLGLALSATPVPGAAVVAVRLARVGRRRDAAVLAGTVAVLVTAGSAVLLAAPWTTPASALTAFVLWAAGGLLGAVLETRAGVAPARSETGGEVWPRVAIWSAAVVVAAIPVAFFAAGVFSRWGSDLFAKPSMPRQVLWTAAVLLVPVGAVTGFLRSWFRMPRRLAAPVNFALSLWTVLIAFLVVALLLVLVSGSLFETELELLEWRYPLWLDALLAVALVTFWVGLSLHLSDARGTADFLSRCATMGLLMAFYWLNVFFVNGEVPLALAAKRAAAAAEDGRHREAARRWAWLARRAGSLPVGPAAVENGVREAVLAGDAGTARGLLAKLTGELGDGAGEERLATARALLATDLRLDEVEAVAVRPAGRDGTFGNSWAAFLTAVAQARPQVSESRLKQKVRALSWSAETIDLPYLSSLDNLRAAASVFDCELVAVASEDRGRMLAAGVPLLFLDSGRSDWQLLFFRSPGADAALWLDYRRWQDDPLDAEDVERLIGGDEDLEAPARRALATISRLGSDSALAERVRREGLGFFAVVDREAVLPRTAALAPRLELDRARRAIDWQAFERAGRRIEKIEPGPARRELEAALWLRHGRKKTGEADAGMPAAVEKLVPEALDTTSSWFLATAAEVADTDPAIGCEWRPAITRAQLRRFPSDAAVLERALLQAVLEEDGPAASELALRLARRHRWSDDRILEALAVLAELGNAGPARRAVAVLVGRLGTFPSTSDEDLGRPRSAHAPYCAARALLATDVGKAVGWWRRAMELDPRRAAYPARLAGALEALGRPDEAEEMRRKARRVRGLRRCQDPAAETRDGV